MEKYTLKAISKIFGKSIVFIIICALVGGLVMGFYAKKKQVTTYKAKQNIVISHNINNVSGQNNVDAQNSLVNADMNMMKTYSSIAENMKISEAAHKELPSHLKKKISISDINSSVNTSTHDQSLVLTITAKTKNPKYSVAIAKSVGKAMKYELHGLQPGSGDVTLLASPTYKDVDSETTPHAKKYAVVGIAIGGLFGIIVSFSCISIENYLKNR
ncbi:chain length determinant protein [Limosilactobacillus coleohominis 101-4-CHN]|uniref:Chain length determinant protein n=1 Tax=Limosilactobacillus coleohominis 101-4-CHN TaxID=575594 RepID=C7XW36_9LACO|nr:LPS biosynthesis protein [Limosilactobacillus coleohominis]EEU30552.1 chain length determinant protein [Limosilactobacillus coleohominis 101-4-CHN]